MSSDEPRPVEIYRARNIALAHLLKGVLEREGIPALIENDLLQVGEAPVGWTTMPRVLVDADQVLEARAIAEEFDANQARDSAGDATEQCLSCGAPLPEDEDHCPACGWSYK